MALETYAQRGIEDFGTALGRYVIMPDHIHLFVCGDIEFELSNWVAGLKRAISTAIRGVESFGSQVSSITSCEAKKAIPRNGNTFVRILFEQVW